MIVQNIEYAQSLHRLREFQQLITVHIVRTYIPVYLITTSGDAAVMTVSAAVAETIDATVAVTGTLIGCCSALVVRANSRPISIFATPSPGWGPRGQGPSKNRQGPGKNNWTVHVKKIEKDQMATLCCVPWRLDQTAESHSLLSRLSRA